MSEREIRYRGNSYAANEFERQFNPRADNPDIGLQLEERSKLAAATRTHLSFTPDVSYGPSPRQTLDIFHGDPNRRGECADLLFFHGGYWRAGHGSENCFVAEAFVDAGATVVMASYDLCPNVRIGTIVEQAGQALDWLVQNGAAHGVDSNRLWIGGHSAGAHLCAMILADPSSPPVAGGLLASGIYDLDPVLNISLNAEIQARTEDVAPWSPLNHPPVQQTEVLLTVGADEPFEWQRQTHLYADVARGAGCATETVIEAGANHLGLLFDLRSATSESTQAALAKMKT